MTSVLVRDKLNCSGCTAMSYQCQQCIKRAVVLTDQNTYTLSHSKIKKQTQMKGMYNRSHVVSFERSAHC